MKKIINDPLAFVDQTIAGILKAHPGHLKRVPGSGRAMMLRAFAGHALRGSVA